VIALTPFPPEIAGEMFVSRAGHRYGSRMVRFPAVAIILVLLGGAARADMAGRAQVVDGDTLQIGGETVRLFGIDAPEPDQTCASGKGRTFNCGALAHEILERMTRGYAVSCKERGRDDEGAVLAVCYLGPISINEMMVADGWAMAYPEHGPDFENAERVARSRRDGLWKGRFVPPWDWRQGAR